MLTGPPTCRGNECVAFVASPGDQFNPYSLIVDDGSYATLQSGAGVFTGTANKDGSISWVDGGMGSWIPTSVPKSSEYWNHNSIRGGISSGVKIWLGASVVALIIIIGLLMLLRKQKAYYF
jgi:hypothetical protein